MNKANHVLLQGMEDGSIPMADADAVASGIMEILMHKDKYLQDASIADMLDAFRELSRPDGTSYSEEEAEKLAKEMWAGVRHGARAQVVDGDVNEQAEAATYFAARRLCVVG